MLSPYFQQNAILSLTSLTPNTAVGDNNGSVYTYDSSATLKKIDLVNNFLTTYSVSPTTANIGCFALISGSAILLSTSVAAWENIELATGYKVQAGSFTNGQCWTSHKNQQMTTVGDIVLGTNTGSRIFKFDASSAPYTGSLMTPAWLNTNLTTIIAKPDTGTFLVGSATGVVVEINASADVISGLTLPTTPNDGGTAPVHLIHGMSYYSDILVVSTLDGLTFTYQWSTKTLLDRGFSYINTSSNSSSAYGSSGGGGGLTMCESSSGVTVLGPGVDNTGTSSAFQTVFLGCISASGFDYEADFVTSNVGQKVIACGVDYTYNKSWFMFRTTNTGNFQIYTIPDANLASVDTRSQDPLGTNVAFRCIRLIDYGHSSRVIFDRSLAAGVTSVSCRKNANYIEIAVENGVKADFRGFST